MFIEKPASKNSFAQRKNVFGVGINDAPYMTHFRDNNGKLLRCPYYVTWSNMIKRCYCLKSLEKDPSYKKCKVSKDWLTFSNFRSWMVTKNWKGKALDKDILVNGNKEYSAEHCLFVTHQINNLLHKNESIRGDYPQGVCIHTQNHNFTAHCKVNGARKHIGCYKTPEEAHEAYKQFKSKHILEVAGKYKNEPRLYEALKNHSRMMLL
jgi:hypothetical protein